MSLSSCHTCQHISAEGCASNPSYYHAYKVFSKDLSQDSTSAIADFIKPCELWEQAVEVNFRMSLRAWQCLIDLSLPDEEANLLSPLIKIALAVVSDANPSDDSSEMQPTAMLEIAEPSTQETVSHASTAIAEEAPTFQPHLNGPSVDGVSVLELQQEILADCKLLEAGSQESDNAKTEPDPEPLAEQEIVELLEGGLQTSHQAQWNDSQPPEPDSHEAVPFQNEAESEDLAENPAVETVDNPFSVPEYPERETSHGLVEADAELMRRCLSSEPFNTNGHVEEKYPSQPQDPSLKSHEDFWHVQLQKGRGGLTTSPNANAPRNGQGEKPAAGYGRGSGRTKANPKDPGIFFTL